MTNDANKPVWQWPYSAFGTTKPTGTLKATPKPKQAMTNQPVLLKTTVPPQRLDLRYPGQMEDAESGTFQNYWRGLDPKSGRYSQFDPIGLRGGWNGFGYGYQNSLRNTDPLGLFVPQAAIAACMANPACVAAAMAAATATTAACVSTIEAVRNWMRSEGVDNTSAGKEPPVPGATPGRETKGRTTQWEKGGGMDQANEDFDAQNPTDVRALPDGGRRGTLPDGRQINVRPDSTDGRPTLEIQNGKNRDKVRYW